MTDSENFLAPKFRTCSYLIKQEDLLPVGRFSILITLCIDKAIKLIELLD